MSIHSGFGSSSSLLLLLLLLLEAAAADADDRGAWGEAGSVMREMALSDRPCGVCFLCFFIQVHSLTSCAFLQ